jgi:hypothetical protein
MARWRIKPSSLVVLGCATLAILLLVVLPDVDPLDTAFQRGTAPISIHAQATSPPGAVHTPAALQLPVLNPEAFHQFHALKYSAVPSEPNFLPILLRTIRR